MQEKIDKELFIIQTPKEIPHISSCPAYYMRKKSDGTGAYFLQFPTNNCQVGCVNNWQGIAKTFTVEEMKWAIKELVKNGFATHQLLIDIRGDSDTEQMIYDVFGKENLVFRQEYKSTNHSQMVMLLVKIEDINREAEEEKEAVYASRRLRFV